MDLGTIIGLGLGAGMVILGILVGGANPLIYWELSSVFITVGGSFGALMISNPLSRVLSMMKYLSLAFRTPVWAEEKIITTLVSFSEKARREGLLALEDDLEEVEDEFMRKGIQLVVDGTDPDIIKNILYTELNQVQGRHASNIKVIDDWSKLAPAFGMIGTLTGLIAMLANMEDTSAIGSGMAQALITTMYGSLMANLLLIPFKNKLIDLDEGETLVKELIIEGILSIQSGDNPRILEEKLIAFLAPTRREAVRQEAARD